ncbi:MAG: hypothetical protein R3C12_24450 [Planctomycetaceae bacterium]
MYRNNLFMLAWISSPGRGGGVRHTGPRHCGNAEYNRDIRPILAEYRFACHGPDSAARKADLPRLAGSRD